MALIEDPGAPRAMELLTRDEVAELTGLGSPAMVSKYAGRKTSTFPQADRHISRAPLWYRGNIEIWMRNRKRRGGTPKDQRTPRPSQPAQHAPPTTVAPAPDPAPPAVATPEPAPKPKQSRAAKEARTDTAAVAVVKPPRKPSIPRSPLKPPRPGTPAAARAARLRKERDGK